MRKTHYLYPELGAAIKQLRLRAQVPVKELITELHCSYRTYYDVISGKI